MTGFIVSVFPFRNRVSSKEAFEGLELGERKLSRPVLRGPGGRKAAWLLGSYSLTFRICPPGQRLSAPLVPIELFAIRLKKRRIANQAIRIESTSCMKTKEFCGAAWPSRELKRKERNS